MPNKVKQKTVSQFLKDHLWEIMVMIVGGILIFYGVKADVKANTNDIIEIKEKQATYPSQEWFDLKFKSEREYSDLKFDALEKKIDNIGTN